MPQGALAVSQTPASLAQQTALNVIAPAVIKATAGTVVAVSVLAIGSAGVIAFNDCATLAAATTANQVLSFAYNSALYPVGSVINLVFPFKVGITLSAVPTGGQLAIAYS